MLGDRRKERNESVKDNWRVIALYSRPLICMLCI